MTDPVMLLSELHGEGRVTFRALRTAGFETLGAIVETQVQVLADRAHLSTGTAQKLKSGAEELLDKGAGPQAGRQASSGTRRMKVAGRRKARGREDGAGGMPRNPGGPMFFSIGIDREEASLLGQGAPVTTAAHAVHEVPQNHEVPEAPKAPRTEEPPVPDPEPVAGPAESAKAEPKRVQETHLVEESTGPPRKETAAAESTQEAPARASFWSFG